MPTLPKGGISRRKTIRGSHAKTTKGDTAKRNTAKRVKSREKYGDLLATEALLYPDNDPPRLQWECSACMYHNDDQDFLACALCATPKNGNEVLVIPDDESTAPPPSSTTAPKETLTGSCPICCESNVPLIHLMKGCKKHHEPACYSCLRRIFVVDAQESVASYPLQCYHPGCRLPVRETQLIKHGLVTSKAELGKYFRLKELSKGHRQGAGSKETAHCPNCDHPRTYSKSSRRLVHEFTCKNCHSHYTMPDSREMMALRNDVDNGILVNNGNDDGYDDGWARCPGCKVVISKGRGCNRMCCGLCKHQFSWTEARKRELSFLLFLNLDAGRRRSQEN